MKLSQGDNERRSCGSKVVEIKSLRHSITPSLHHTSLSATQGHNRVKLGGLAGGNYAEEKADTTRDTNGEDDSGG
ncbi:MAG: hypothetical protein Fur0046_18800 [Cyanobacteria bacterium J069]